MQLRRIAGIAGAGAGLAIALAACGTSSGSSHTSSVGSQPALAVRNISGTGAALVSANGKTLYFTDQDTSAAIRCVGACVRIWVPMTVSSGVTPMAGAGVTGTVATVHRPDGSSQVTYNGKPLYTFMLDSGVGHADGNGVTDSFNGTNFTWHAAVASGSAPSGSSSTHSNGGYGNY